MPKGACVARLGGIGDDLIVSSVFPLLQKKYGRLDVICQPPYDQVLEHDPHIDRLIPREEGSLPGEAYAWQAWFRDRAKEYEFFVNLSHSIETMLAWVPGQTQFTWPKEFRRQHCGVSYLERVHDICGVPRIYNPRFFATDEEKEKAKETKAKMGPYVVGWALGGSRIDKVYPFSTFAIARIIKELNTPVVMLGAPGRDFGNAETIMNHVKQQNGSTDGIHLALSSDKDNPNWPIRRSLSQAQVCDVFITPDTGLGWAVAMEPMPKIVLVSHASARNITHGWVNTVTLEADKERVPCFPCHGLVDRPEDCTLLGAPKPVACIADISVERIVNETRAAMTRASLEQLKASKPE